MGENSEGESDRDELLAAAPDAGHRRVLVDVAQGIVHGQAGDLFDGLPELVPGKSPEDAHGLRAGKTEVEPERPFLGAIDHPGVSHEGLAGGRVEAEAELFEFLADLTRDAEVAGPGAEIVSLGLRAFLGVIRHGATRARRERQEIPRSLGPEGLNGKHGASHPVVLTELKLDRYQRGAKGGKMMPLPRNARREVNM